MLHKIKFLFKPSHRRELVELTRRACQERNGEMREHRVLRFAIQNQEMDTVLQRLNQNVKIELENKHYIAVSESK